MALFPFWKSMWSPLRPGDGTRRVQGLQFNSPQASTFVPSTPVTEDTALQVSAAWACVNILSDTVAGLPVNVFKRSGDHRERVNNHWLTKLLHKPNRYQSKVEFFNTLMLNLVLQGNCYCRIDRIGDRIVSLMPMLSAQVQVKLEHNGDITYIYINQDGEMEYLKSKDVWHVKRTGNGIIGKSPLEFAKQSMGISQAMDKNVADIYRNGGKRSGVLTVPGTLDNDTRAKFKDGYSSITGAGADRLLVLEAGMTFEPVAMSPGDLDLLNSRKFSIEEICRFFAVPSVLVNDTSKSTALGTGIEQIIQGFYKTGIKPYLNLFQDSISRWLLSDADADIFVDFDLDDLLRADIKTRGEYYKSAITGSFLTTNEVRRMENMPPVEGGDKIIVQLGFAPIDMLEESVIARGAKVNPGGAEDAKPKVD